MTQPAGKGETGDKPQTRHRSQRGCSPLPDRSGTGSPRAIDPMTEPAVGRGQKPPDGLQPSAWGTGTAPQPPTPLLHGERVQGKAGASGGNKVGGQQEG